MITNACSERCQQMHVLKDVSKCMFWKMLSNVSFERWFQVCNGIPLRNSLHSAFRGGGGTWVWQLLLYFKTKVVKPFCSKLEWILEKTFSHQNTCKLTSKLRDGVNSNWMKSHFSQHWKLRDWLVLKLFKNVYFYQSQVNGFLLVVTWICQNC